MIHFSIVKQPLRDAQLLDLVRRSQRHGFRIGSPADSSMMDRSSSAKCLPQHRATRRNIERLTTEAAQASHV